MLASQSDLCSNFAACPACQARIARAAEACSPSPQSPVPSPSLRLVTFDRAREEIVDGDVLLWRPTSLLGRLIAWATRSTYSHASMATWLCDDVAALEMLQWRGGCASNLKSRATAGRAVATSFGPATRAAMRGTRWIRCSAWSSRITAGWISPISWATATCGCRCLPMADTRDPEQPRVCSAAVAWAIRTGAGQAGR